MALPKRPLTHQIEDKSVNAFKKAMPDHWVVRDKSHDYGIDQEVEIFEPDGTATGILFYVQLKATSSKDEEKQKSVSIRRGSLAYYAELDLPVLIARYAEAADAFHFKWNHEISLLDVPEDQESLTVKFGDLPDFVDYSPEGLKKTALALRKLRAIGNDTPINISVTFSSDNTNQAPSRYTRIIQQSLPRSRLFTVNGNDATSELNLSLTLKDEELQLHVDSLYPTTIGTERLDDTNLSSNISYCLCAFLVRAQLLHHARVLADHLLSQGTQTQNGFLAFKSCTAFQSDVVKSLELALVNNVHHQVDEFWVSLSSYILSQELSRDIKSKVMIRLNTASLDHLKDEAPPEVLASFHYNIGNSYKSVDNHFAAIRSYNKARKIDPSYLERGYFLQEVGAALFLRHKYTPASRFYEKHLEIDENDSSRFVLADALFFSGKLKEALDLLNKICTAKPGPFTFEVALKAHLISSLIDHHQKDEVSRDQTEAKRRLSELSDKLESPEAVEAYLEIINSIDPLNGWASFNLAISLSQEKRPKDALHGFLMQAFTVLNDAEAWANAFACALSAKDLPKETVAAIGSLGQHHCGSDFNKHWDTLCEQNQIPPSAIEACEAVFAFLLGIEEEKEGGLATIRLAPGGNPESDAN
ncbi:MAG: DUF4365 domain-containing protein [Rhodospirillales bacterium]|nr:DUF4365 domain-containing protein [Rhodospirillales bacterium]